MLAALLAVIPQADPLPLPAPPWILWALLMLTFFLHVLPMNVVLGGSIIAGLARLRGAHPDRLHHRELAAFMGKAMPTLVAATITFGVAPLLFVQTLYGRLLFTGSVLIGWFWFAVIPLLILAYYGTYLLAFRSERLGRAAGPLGLLTALFFMAIAFIYSNNMSLMLRPDAFADLYLGSGRGLHLNLDDPTLVPRYLHFLMGAIAVSGMAVALYGVVRQKEDPELGRFAIRHGALWFALPTLVNVGSGLWWLIALPKEVMLRFMGQNLFATVTLGLGIVFALGALFMMAMAIYSPEPRGLVKGAGWSLLITLLTMIFTRDQVRQGALARAGFELPEWVAPQWGTMALFAVLLVGALVTTAWMVVLLARGKERAA